MSHACPDCGQTCFCCGDIEDHDTGDEYFEVCEHHLICEATEELDPADVLVGYEEHAHG